MGGRKGEKERGKDKLSSGEEEKRQGEKGKKDRKTINGKSLEG